MRNGFRVFALALQLVALVGGTRLASAQATETYVFRDSFAPIEGAGNVLVPVSNAARTIVTSGPDFLNGSFVTETISSLACASTPTIRAWSFPATAGLRHDNGTPSIVTGSYSISMLMRYNPMDAGYARLIDFSNSTLDTGIYKLGDGVSFYPVGTFAAGSFVADQDVFITITRDGTSKLVSLYIDGIPSGTYVDTGDLYAPSATVLYFLLDNTTGSAAISETDPGVIAYLQLRSTPMTPAEVTASLSAICTVVEQAGCANGPGAATFESILCRLDALITRVTAETRLGTFQAKSVNSLQQAKARTQSAQAASKAKKARKALQQAAKALSGYARRLGSQTARKKLDATLRTEFQQAADPIKADLGTLRSQL